MVISPRKKGRSALNQPLAPPTPSDVISHSRLELLNYSCTPESQHLQLVMCRYWTSIRTHRFYLCPVVGLTGRFCLVFWKDNLVLKVKGNRESLLDKTLKLLINRLLMCCYSIKPNFNFFGLHGLDMKMCKKEIPGLYRIVTRKDAPTAKDAVSYIDKFFKVDTDCELVFSRLEDFTIIDFEAIKEYVTSKGLDHICDDVHYMTVFVQRTPQYWRDKILASGKMYNHKYFIHPPTSQS
ncbi:hypothetical protein J6590_092736 [Homalodisca vitripennis]|nr:hypothetical protein J6590_092736 [Homalodisca vitripennis]